MSDSKTESDEDIKSLVVIGQRKKNTGKRPMIDLENVRTSKDGEGKNSKDEDAKQFKSKEHVDPG